MTGYLITSAIHGHREPSVLGVCLHWEDVPEAIHHEVDRITAEWVTEAPGGWLVHRPDLKWRYVDDDRALSSEGHEVRAEPVPVWG